MMKQSKATISLPKNYSKTLQQMVVGVNFKNHDVGLKWGAEDRKGIFLEIRLDFQIIYLVNYHDTK